MAKKMTQPDALRLAVIELEKGRMFQDNSKRDEAATVLAKMLVKMESIRIKQKERKSECPE